MDTLSNGPEPILVSSGDVGDVDRDSETPDLTWRHPSSLAVVSFVLAVLSLLGASVFRGLAYTVAFAPQGQSLGDGGQEGTPAFMTAGAFVTAAFALLPLLLARLGLRSVVADDGPWTAHLLRAAFLLAGVSLVLHLVIALVATTSDDPYSSFFSYVSG